MGTTYNCPLHIVANKSTSPSVYKCFLPLHTV
nr:MAG TPA: hypothetical protein [Caudoviricetes sp.]DAQ44238.1 MAG TPA: hypothetical protein [Bacteriophage sp.]